MTKGDTVVMEFEYFKIKERTEYEVLYITQSGEAILVGCDYRFDAKTGRCLNDCNFEGSQRRLVVDEMIL